MKKYLLVVLVFVTFLYSCESESFVEEELEEVIEDEVVERIFDGNVFLRTQEEVDTFGAEEYNIINGSLWIGPRGIGIFDITDLSSLSTLRRINFGSLSLELNPFLESLYGLHNIKSVHVFRLSGCDQIVDLTDLESLVEIGQKGEGIEFSPALNIINNSSLQTLDGLENIVSAGHVTISQNYNLVSIDGLSNLTTVICLVIGGYDFELPLAGNLNLTDFCSLHNLFAFGTYNEECIIINGNSFNPTIEDIIAGDCRFRNNKKLTKTIKS